MKSRFLKQVRQQNPLVHNITNIVAANFAANGLLAIGASPLMSNSIEEMEEIARFSQVLVINIGTLLGNDVEAMLLAGKTANKVGIPVVLDPVAVGATQFRRETVKRLLNEVKFTLIRGNAGEIAALAGVQWEAKGVDAGSGQGDVAALAKKAAHDYRCIVALSGEIDVISDGSQVVKIANGTPMFPKITASGCLLGAICGAFLAVAKSDDYFDATLEACATYAIAGERAAASLNPTEFGQFEVGLLDNLGGISAEMIEQYARITYA